LQASEFQNDTYPLLQQLQYTLLRDTLSFTPRCLALLLYTNGIKGLRPLLQTIFFIYCEDLGFDRLFPEDLPL